MVFRQLNEPLGLEMKDLMIRAEFSARDFAAWLDEPYTSTYQWIRGVVPHSPTYEKILDRMEALRFALKFYDFADIPTQGQRRLDYIQGTCKNVRRSKAFKGRAAA